jgi:hypothetical protein
MVPKFPPSNSARSIANVWEGAVVSSLNVKTLSKGEAFKVGAAVDTAVEEPTY